MPGPTAPRSFDATRRADAQRGPAAAASPITRLHRHGARRRPEGSAASDAEREHATEVVSHLLHRECGQWSWNAHGAAAHRAEASEIVGALCREGWGPGRSAA